MTIGRWADLGSCLHVFRSVGKKVEVIRFGEC